MGDSNGNGGPKVTLSLGALLGALVLGLVVWSASLVWTKADGAAPKNDVQQIDTRLRGVEMGQVLLKRDVELVQEDITETKGDVKDIKNILERRFGTGNGNAAPVER